MKLGQAYETLKDESLRRAYDVIYLKIKSSSTHARHAPPQPKPSPTPTPTPATSAAAARRKQEDAQDDAAKAAAEKAISDCADTWHTAQKQYENTIFESNRVIRQLQKTIADLAFIRKAEKDEDAAANSWGTWIMSPLYAKRTESEEEKQHKANERLMRLHNSNLKEQMLNVKMQKLKVWETDLEQARVRFETTDRIYDARVKAIQERINARRRAEQQDRMAEAQAALAKARQETYERQRREASAHAARQKAEQAAAWAEQVRTRKAREEEARKQQEARAAREEANRRQTARETPQKNRTSAPFSSPAAAQTSRIACSHDGWWPKVEGRRACEKCSNTFRFVLECPNCKMKACASCQHDLRPKRSQQRKQPSKKPAYRPQTPDYDYANDYF